MRLLLLVTLWVLAAQLPSPTPKKPDVPYVPTGPETVEAMLDLAKVTKDDVVYDLGSGDGRIVIAAAKRGARAVGVEIDPKLVALSRELAAKAGVSSLTEFRQEDLFVTDLRPATVVTLYLFPKVNLLLRPKLKRDLKPGSRIVSQMFDMGDWKFDRMVELKGRLLYLWVIP